MIEIWLLSWSETIWRAAPVLLRDLDFLRCVCFQGLQYGMDFDA